MQEPPTPSNRTQRSRIQRSRGASAPPGRETSDDARPANRFINRPRLRDFDYTGTFTYHVTIVTTGRRPLLTGTLAPIVMDKLHEAANTKSFDILAFTLMPDHMHMLVASADDNANLIRFMQRFKQLTSYASVQLTGERLWQPSFHDHALRRDEDVFAVAQYIIDNPRRANLLADGETWPYQGGSLLPTTGRS